MASASTSTTPQIDFDEDSQTTGNAREGKRARFEQLKRQRSSVEPFVPTQQDLDVLKEGKDKTEYFQALESPQDQKGMLIDLYQDSMSKEIDESELEDEDVEEDSFTDEQDDESMFGQALEGTSPTTLTASQTPASSTGASPENVLVGGTTEAAPGLAVSAGPQIEVLADSLEDVLDTGAQIDLDSNSEIEENRSLMPESGAPRLQKSQNDKPKELRMKRRQRKHVFQSRKPKQKV
ncbi:hypothetical protein K491DRAFT_677590 [Lophiostoma macrostomum CBS 122681]|uniref:Uncharacterized protein n=1 Tax=Lophiostoma macrostomum CBS 122681 TaxID=1314788 RepID=A0A6A6TCD6_9PLEO|nr:hypothetical protein K491DRAFT_677590 [Lophiostoma macrostomum CBS 122681]